MAIDGLTPEMKNYFSSMNPPKARTSSTSSASATPPSKSAPTSVLDGDPFHFSSISYPRDVTSDMANGHYMLFYVNVQNKTKYFMDPQDGTQLGKEITTVVAGKELKHFETYADTEATY